MRAVAFTELPPWLGLPSIHSGYWDPFFAACEETGTVVAMHIGSGTKTLADVAGRARRGAGVTTSSPTARCRWSTSSTRACSCASPSLKLLYAEAQIGWIPYVLERVDDVWDDAPGLERQPGQRAPSRRRRYYYRQVYSCFFKDGVGVEILDRVGATTSRSRPTTRTRTAPGPTRTRWRRSCSATSTPTP